MAALTQARMPIEESLKNIPLLLDYGSGMTAYVGGIACIDTSAHLAKPGAAGNANLVKVGEWLETVDNSAASAATYVMASLDREIWVRWYDSATGGAAVTDSYLYGLCYLLDDHTVTNSSSGNSVAGRVWKTDAIKGVAVQAIYLY